MLTACASAREEAAYGDPLSPVNRRMHSLNETVSDRVLAPAGDRVDGAMSDGAESNTANVTGYVKNVFSNLGEPSNMVNGALQGEAGTVGVGASRFAINSTVGVLGVFDVATALGIEERKEDFGQTLGSWGAPSGPYVVAPLAGETNARDLTGGVVDSLLNPFSLPEAVSVAKQGAGVVDTLDSAQEEDEERESGEIRDPYAYDRAQYEMRRRAMIENRHYDRHNPEEVTVEHRYQPEPAPIGAGQDD